MLSVIVLVIYYYLPHHKYQVVLIAISVTVCLFDILRAYSLKFKALCNMVFSQVLRESEKSRTLSGLSYMMLGFLGAYLICGNTALYTASCLILIIADPIAGLVGYFLGARGNLLKLLTFMLIAIAIGTYVNTHFLVHANNQILGYYAPHMVILGSCFITSIIEKYSRNLSFDDNLSIPISYAATTKILEMILVKISSVFG